MSTTCADCDWLWQRAVKEHEEMLNSIQWDFSKEELQRFERQYPIKPEDNLCPAHEVAHWNESFAKLRAAHTSQQEIPK